MTTEPWKMFILAISVSNRDAKLLNTGSNFYFYYVLSVAVCLLYILLNDLLHSKFLFSWCLSSLYVQFQTLYTDLQNLKSNYILKLSTVSGIQTVVHIFSHVKIKQKVWFTNHLTLSKKKRLFQFSLG